MFRGDSFSMDSLRVSLDCCGSLCLLYLQERGKSIAYDKITDLKNSKNLYIASTIQWMIEICRSANYIYL